MQRLHVKGIDCSFLSGYLQIPKDPVRRRILEFAQLTQQLQRVHPNVLAKALKRGILFQNKEIVVINKPYGLPVHGEGNMVLALFLIMLLTSLEWAGIWEGFANYSDVLYSEGIVIPLRKLVHRNVPCLFLMLFNACHRWCII